MIGRAQVRGDHQIAYLLGRCADYLRAGDLFRLLEELDGDVELVSGLEAAVADVASWKTKRFDSIFEFRLFRIVLYALVRATQPRVAIETGVLHGMTSAFLLRALQRNGTGNLISIDLPSYAETGPANQDGYYATLPPAKHPGWMVDEALRERWDLRLGPSTTMLPALQLASGALDFFLHDSDHTDATMTFELEFAWGALSPRGILVCDNIDSCDAFERFCRRIDREPLRLPAPDMTITRDIRFGILRRSQ